MAIRLIDEPSMFLSPFAALHDLASYYDRCRASGKTHTRPSSTSPRHRISVLFAMLREGIAYEPRSPASLDETQRGTPCTEGGLMSASQCV